MKTIQDIRKSLKQRRDEAIKTGKVYESSKFNEATDWTYDDFRAATQILINRLIQMRDETNVEVPTEKEAKLVADVAKMANIWSKKVIDVFYNDKKVGHIQDPTISGEEPIPNETIEQITNVIREVLGANPGDINRKFNANRTAVQFTFVGKSEHGCDLATFIDVFKMNNKLVCALSCYDYANKNNAVDKDTNPDLYFDLTDMQNEQEFINKIKRLYEVFEQKFGNPEKELVPANNSLSERLLRELDSDILEILNS